MIALSLLLATTACWAEEPSLLVYLDHAPEMSDACLPQPVYVWNEFYTSKNGPIAIAWMQIDLHNTNYEPITMVSNDPDGNGPAEAILTEPNDIVEQYHAFAAVNANAFARATNADHKPGWHLGLFVDIQGLAVSAGEVRSPMETDVTSPTGKVRSRYGFWLDHNDLPIFGQPVDYDNIQNGVGDWFSPLLLDGKIIPTQDESRHPRTVVGVDQQNRFMILAVIDGRRKGHSIGMTLYELAELMKSRGYHHAINLDGGGSSIMLYQEGEDLKTANKPSGNRHRPIPVMLGVRGVTKPHNP